MPAGESERLITKLPKLKYRKWKRAAESRVVKWRWGSSLLSSIDPSDDLVRSGRRAVEFSDPRRRGEPGSVAEGLDEHGQVCVRHVYMMLVYRGQQQRIETFFKRKRNRVSWAQFGYSEPDKPLWQFHEMDYQGGLPRVYRFCLGEHGYGVKRYEYQGDRLVRMHERRFEGEPIKEHASVTEFTWGNVRRPDLVQKFRHDGRVETVFRRRTREASLHDLLEQYEEGAVKLIPEAVRKLGVEDPVYSVVLSFDWGNDILPPGVSIGVESERQEWFSKHHKESLWYVWNPSEFKHGYIDCMGLASELAETGRMISQLARSHRRDKYAVAMLRRVAKRLQSFDWTGIAPLTDDFVAIAVDFELAGLKEAIEVSADADLLVKLKAKGLVP